MMFICKNIDVYNQQKELLDKKYQEKLKFLEMRKTESKTKNCCS